MTSVCQNGLKFFHRRSYDSEDLSLQELALATRHVGHEGLVRAMKIQRRKQFELAASVQAAIWKYKR